MMSRMTSKDFVNFPTLTEINYFGEDISLRVSIYMECQSRCKSKHSTSVV